DAFTRFHSRTSLDDTPETPTEVSLNVPLSTSTPTNTPSPHPPSLITPTPMTEHTSDNFCDISEANILPGPRTRQQAHALHSTPSFVPRSFQHAQLFAEASQWNTAYQTEIDNIERIGELSVVDRPS